MEIENDIEETYDITAKQLYDRLESWNKDVKDSFVEGKKKKKTYLKLKDLLIKFNKRPTPIKDVELIDIKLGSKIICPEDNCFLNAIISINPILFEVKSNCGIHERKLDIIKHNKYMQNEFNKIRKSKTRIRML